MASKALALVSRQFLSQSRGTARTDAWVGTGRTAQPHLDACDAVTEKHHRKEKRETNGFIPTTAASLF